MCPDSESEAMNPITSANDDALEGAYAEDGSPSISAVIDANMVGTYCARADDESVEGLDSRLV